MLFNLYRRQSTSDFTRSVTRIFPFPVAKVNGSFVSYESYLFELGTAIKFGLLYGVILLAARAAQMYLGDAGTYASALLSGLTDVDAITLSMAELSKPGNGLSMDTAARSIVLAISANTVVKGSIVLTTASAAMRKPFLPGFVLMLVTGLAAAFLLI